MNWFTEEDVAEMLDQHGPSTLKLRTHRDEDDGSLWFFHPDWDGVFCRIGNGDPAGRNRDRVFLLWAWLREDRVHVLTMRDATGHEVELMRRLQNE